MPNSPVMAGQFSVGREPWSLDLEGTFDVAVSVSVERERLRGNGEY